MIKDLALAVNIDHIASLRALGQNQYPDPVHAALEAEAAGADAIKVHLKKLHPHVTFRDVSLINEVLSCDLNVEIPVEEDFVVKMCEVKPAAVCLVAEDTKAGGYGLNFQNDKSRIADIVGELKSNGIATELSISPSHEALEQALQCGVGGVALHSLNVLHPGDNKVDSVSLESFFSLAAEATNAGLVVSAGHGITYNNVSELAAAAAISRVNVGHAIVARAVICGLDAAIKEMKSLIHQARLKLLAAELATTS